MDTIKKYMKEEKLIVLPKKQKDKYEILEYLCKRFKEGVFYSEKEVNDILKQVYLDYVLIRRYMIDFKLLQRQKDGTTYKLVNKQEKEGLL